MWRAIGVCLVLMWGCGADEEAEASEETEESSNDESSSDDEGEGDDDHDHDDDDDESHVEPDPDSLDLSVHVEEHQLDEETTNRVAAATRGIAHILIRYRGASRAPSAISRTQAAAEERAQQALTRVNGGEDFAAVAADMSDDEANKDHGGEMGRLEQGLLPGPLDEALFAMSTGDVRGPIETPLGFHVIKRTE